MKVNELTGLKRCPGCESEKDSSLYYVDRASSDGLSCRCKSCIDAHQALKPKTPERNRIDARRWTLRTKFGLTEEAYASMLAGQLGLCAICGQPETNNGRSGAVKPLAIDHDHKSGKVRGLLCDNCNQALGRMEDDPERLEAAARYLRGAELSK